MFRVFIPIGKSGFSRWRVSPYYGVGGHQRHWTLAGPGPGHLFWLLAFGFWLLVSRFSFLVSFLPALGPVPFRL